MEKELKNLLKNMLEAVEENENDSEEMKADRADARKNIVERLEDFECVICVTESGITTLGRGCQILAMVSALVENLKKQGLDDDAIKAAVKKGLNSNDEKENDENKKDELIEMLKNIFE